MTDDPIEAIVQMIEELPEFEHKTVVISQIRIGTPAFLKTAIDSIRRERKTLEYSGRKTGMCAQMAEIEKAIERQLAATPAPAREDEAAV
jgi:hypothetical protein